MKRRNFLKIAGATASIPFLMKGVPLYAKSSPFLDQIANNSNAEDRILVLIQLNGGNDGLNTVIPLDQIANLSQVRPQVLLPENSLIKITEEQGLHPALDGLEKLWKEEKFEIVQNVGYPEQNFSHFRSTDIWTSASDANQYVGSGWLGRYIAENHPDFPENYPNEENTDPLSLTVGSLVSQTCQGPVFSMGVAVKDLESFYNVEYNDNLNSQEGYAGGELEYINNVIRQTKSYMNVLEEAASKGSINESLWGDTTNNPLAEQMKVIAQLINGGLKTKIYVCSITGFDTHANQVEPNNHVLGFHAQLLSNLGNAINSFQKQIEAYGIEDKVLGMTFSEFGRRIIGNDSNGTDHGAAAPHFFFGTSVNPIVHGTNSEIPTDAGPQDNLEEQFDFRSLYWSVLKDWFQVSDEKLLKIMFKEFDHVQILRPDITSIENTEDYQYNAKILEVFPNPTINFVELQFYTIDSHVKITINDLFGRNIATIVDRYFTKGRHQFSLDNVRIPSGNYIISLRNSHGFDTFKLAVAR